MGLSIKPLLGQGTITLVSLFDDAVDWDNCPLSQEEYATEAWKHAKSLPGKPDGDAIILWHFRAPEEKDIAAVDSQKYTLDEEGNSAAVRNIRKESYGLFRRCLRDVENYSINGEEVKVELIKGSLGEMASEKTMNLVPFEVATELGMYLRASQQLSDDTKND